MKRWLFFTLIAIAGALTLGCTTLDEKQRAWIFQPSDRAWGGTAELAQGMDEVWIAFDSKATGQGARLHGLWLAADGPHAAQAPVLLYLHGARWNVEGSAPRIKRMQELGFSVLAIDYRGFGKSTAGLPSEDTAYEDARAAWDWLAAKYPQRPRYIFGHSLGGAIAIDLAARVHDERGTIVEGTFTSIPELAGTMKLGWLQGSWLPMSMLVTQRFDSLNKVAKIGSPLLVVHGDSDSLIASSLGKKLFEAAKEPKQFVLVEGGSHFSTLAMAQAQYRKALGQLFSLK
ncbi:MAG: alpha/beta fold hydrolase [Burkholderiales bacterium]|nr:alpha/beta fold hydrolase [Burkholderiales bacterium]